MKTTTTILGAFLIFSIFLVGCDKTTTTEIPLPEEWAIGSELPHVSMNQPFILQENQSVILQETGTILTLRKLIFSPCVLVVRCDWKGTAVHILVKEQSGEETRIELVSSNYTYVTQDYILGLMESDFRSTATFGFFPLGTNITVRTSSPQEIVVRVPTKQTTP